MLVWFTYLLFLLLIFYTHLYIYEGETEKSTACTVLIIKVKSQVHTFSRCCCLLLLFLWVIVWTCFRKTNLKWIGLIVCLILYCSCSSSASVRCGSITRLEPVALIGTARVLWSTVVWHPVIQTLWVSLLSLISLIDTVSRHFFVFTIWCYCPPLCLWTFFSITFLPSCSRARKLYTHPVCHLQAIQHRADRLESVFQV